MVANRKLGNLHQIEGTKCVFELWPTNVLVSINYLMYTLKFPLFIKTRTVQRVQF